MSTDLVIARLGSALAALGEAKTIQDTKAILDVATAAEIYAKRQKMSDESIAFAHDVKTEALRQLGEYLAAAPKSTGAAGIGTSAVPDRNHTPTLAEQGIDKKTSMTAQRLAALPPEKFQAVKAGKVSIAKATATPKPEVPKPKGLEPDDDLSEPPPDDGSASAIDEDEEAAQAAIVAAQDAAEYAMFRADDQRQHAIAEIRQLTAKNAALEKEARILRSRRDWLMRERNDHQRRAAYWEQRAKTCEAGKDEF